MRSLVLYVNSEKSVGILIKVKNVSQHTIIDVNLYVGLFVNFYFYLSFAKSGRTDWYNT